MKILKKMERIEWIRDYLLTKDERVDILYSKFVDDYVEKFNPSIIIMPFGANTCKELGLVLSFGYKMNVFDRSIASLIEHESGFPNWVYSYRLYEGK